MSSEDAKPAVARATDEINRRSRAKGPGADAASELAEILAGHERDCTTMARARAKPGREDAAG